MRVIIIVLGISTSGNRIFLEVDSMVVSWWIVAFVQCKIQCFQ